MVYHTILYRLLTQAHRPGGITHIIFQWSAPLYNSYNQSASLSPPHILGISRRAISRLLVDIESTFDTPRFGLSRFRVCQRSMSENRHYCWRMQNKTAPDDAMAVSTGKYGKTARKMWGLRAGEIDVKNAHTRSHPTALSTRKQSGRHSQTRSKCDAFAPCLIATVASVERRDAREGSYASEARTARGRQCFERMNGGIIGGFGCVCQVKSFRGARKCP